MSSLSKVGEAGPQSTIRSAGRTYHRLLFIDNLRWTMIILVISMHAADTYSPFGNWYFVDRVPLAPWAILLFAAWQMYLQAFFMGLLFFIAGIFVSTSFERKGAWVFVRERAFRLGLPVLFYMFVLGPFTEYYLAGSWTSTEATSFAHEWMKHIRNGEFLQENGPLWFCLALLIFSIVYAAVRRTGWDGDRESAEAPSMVQLFCFAVGMAALTFIVRAARPASFLNIQLGNVPQYALMFWTGMEAARRNWLAKMKFAAGVRWLAMVVPAGFAAWLTVLIAGGALQGNEAAYSGGWNWQSAAICAWESLTCVAISFGLLVIYKRIFDSQGATSRFLSENAFSVYVFHPPVVILAAKLMHGLVWHPVLKFGLLTCVGVTVSYLLSAGLFRRVPLLRAIL